MGVGKELEMFKAKGRCSAIVQCRGRRLIVSKELFQNRETRSQASQGFANLLLTGTDHACSSAHRNQVPQPSHLHVVPEPGSEYGGATNKVSGEGAPSDLNQVEFVLANNAVES